MTNDGSSSRFDCSAIFQDVTDDVLVRGLLAGEKRAWREFHARYDQLIRRRITGIVNRFSALVGADDVREVCAMLFVQLLSDDMRKLRSFDVERGSLGSWLGLLATNCAYDHLRALRRTPRPLPLTAAETLCCELPSPVEQAERRQRAELVTGMLQAFSDKDCEFVALYFGEGLAPEQIAQRMHISVKTVYTKRHKIQSRLEAMLSDARLAA